MTPMPNAPNPNAIFGEALARTPAPLPLSTVQEQLAQTAGLNAQAQETAANAQLKQRTVKNLQLMHDNLPALLQASGGKYDDSVFNGLISKGVDPDAVEKIRGDHYMHDQTMANTQHIQALADQAKQDLQDHKSKIAARIAVGLQQTVNPDKTIDPVKLEAQLQNAAIQDPNYDVSGMRALATKDPEKFKAVLGAALATRPDIQEEEEAAQQKHIQTSKAAVELKQQELAQRIRERFAGPLAGTPPGVAAPRLNTAATGGAAQFPELADAVSNEIDQKKNPDEWNLAFGTALNHLQTTGDTGKALDEVHKIAERIATNKETLAREKELKAIPPAINPETQEFRQEDLDLRREMRADTSRRFYSTQLDRYGRPIADLQGRMGRLQDSLDQNSPTADALIAPELLSIMAGGTGSGLRMNQAEINRIVGGRSKWESLRAAAKQWSLDPKTANSITADQRQQIRDLAKTVQDRLASKEQALNDARTELENSNDPVAHQRIVNRVQRKLLEADQPAGAGAGAPTAPPATQHKAGDTRTINGKTYVRDAKGTWTAQ